MLEAAAAAGDDSPERQALLVACDLSEAYVDILARVLTRGRWRIQDYPMEYIRRSAMRAVFKRDEAGKSSREQNSGYSPDELGWMKELADTSEVVRIDGIWRQGGCRDRFQMRPHIDETSCVVAPAIQRLPKDLLVTVDPSEMSKGAQEDIVDPIVSGDWNEIARRANFDQWETQALLFMADGCTLYQAFKLCENDSEKRSLEAAWKRLRRGKLQKLRSFLRD